MCGISRCNNGHKRQAAPRSRVMWRDDTGAHVKANADFLAFLVTDAARQASVQKNEFLCFGLLLPGEMCTLVHALSLPARREFVGVDHI